MKVLNKAWSEKGWMIVSFIIYHLSFSPAGAQQLWTLDECMDYAIAHSSEMAHRQYEQKRHEVKAQASRDARLPRLSGDLGAYTGTLRHSGDHHRLDADMSVLGVGVSAAVPLYTGSRLSSQIKADKYSLLASIEDVRHAEKNLRIQVAAAYLQVLYNKGEAEIARQRLEVSQLLQTRAQSLFDKGKRPESDVAEAAAMVSRDEALLVAAEGEIELSKLDLRQLLNLPDSVDFDIAEPDDNPSPRTPVPPYTISPSHPAILSSGYTIQQAEQEVKVARSGYYPTLSLVGELGTLWASLDTRTKHDGQVPLVSPWGAFGSLSYHFSLDSEWKRKNFLHAIVGLKLSVPIFNAFETRAHIRTAKVNLMDAQLAYDDTRQQLQKDIRQAWQEAVTARKRYEAEVKAETACSLSYQYVLKRYEAGMATLFDLSQSRQQWFTATENALRMKYEYIIREKILEIKVQ